MRLARFVSVVLMLAVSIAAAQADQRPTPDEILDGLGFSEADKQAIEAGEIVAIDLPTVLENQLKGAVAMRVPATLDRVEAYFQGGRALNDDPTVEAFEVLDPLAETDWYGVGLGAEDQAEVKRILEVRPASALNLSPGEAAAFKSELAAVTAGQPGADERVSEVYRSVLAGRYRSYVEKGLEGMPPYVRGVSRKAMPADEIRADLTAASFGILDRFPVFREAILEYPRNQPPGVSNTFYWVRGTVEGRPHYALAHQMTLRGDGFLLVYNRDYYSSHTYNTLQSTFLWLADERGLFGVHVNAGTTDEITGFFGAIARNVGKERMKSDLIANFTELRDRLTK